jgi:hypothetical protein
LIKPSPGALGLHWINGETEMAKTKYKAICPDGTIITRSSDRVYVAAVIAQASYDFSLAQADQDGKNDGSNWEFNCQMVAWGGIYRGERKPWDTDEAIAKSLAQCTERMNEYPSAAAAIAGERAKRIARVEEAKANGYFEQWQLIGFCGRPDLAAKAAAKAQGGRYADVRIVPAVA